MIENVYGNFYNDHNDLIDEANEEINMVNFRGVWPLVVNMKRKNIKKIVLWHHGEIYCMVAIDSW